MSKHTIKFTHGKNGEIETFKGHTIYSNLFILGAFALTSQEKLTKTGFHHKFATNAKGLEELIEKSDDTLEYLQNAIVALGLVMTDTESVHVKENRDELAWLSIGLAELSTMVANNNAEMNNTLRKQ